MEPFTRSPVPSSQCSEPQHVCREIAQEVREMAMALYTGRLSPTVFEKTLLTLEARKVKRFGLHLTAERLPDGSSRFLLENISTGRTCATLDFHPITDELEIHDTVR